MSMDSTKELIFQNEMIAQMIERAGFVAKRTATIANVRCTRRMR
jgi:hypothetical protein